MARFELFKGNEGEFYYRLLSDKGDVLLNSESYNDKDYCLKDIGMVKKNASDLMNYEVKTAASGTHFFNLKSHKGKIIGKSVLYKSPELLNKRMKLIKENAPKATVEEKTLPA